MTPLERWRQDLIKIRHLGAQASFIDDIFYHRMERLVRKDGTVAWQGQLFEVPYELCGQTVYLVFDPHAQKAIRVESNTGEALGPVTLSTPRPIFIENGNVPKVKSHPISASANFMPLKWLIKSTAACVTFLSRITMNKENSLCFNNTLV